MILLVSDADNTLWDTDTVFAQGQLRLLEAIESVMRARADCSDRLSFVRAIDQQLAVLHDYQLSYPPRLLVVALMEALIGASPERAASLALERGASHNHCEVSKLTESFANYIKDQIPALRVGVSVALPRLMNLGARVVVATEGDSKRCRVVLGHYHLTSYVRDVFAARKTSQFYDEIANLNRDCSKRFLVGDQLDRDIALGKTAGFSTIYFPGPFRPTWEAATDIESDFTISSYEDIPRLVSDSTEIRKSSSPVEAKVRKGSGT